jgi:hypothetical protein
MIGPAVPVPVPKDVLEALQSVEVTSDTTGPSGFQLTFNVSKRSPLQTIFLLSGGASIPLVRVVILVTMNGTTEVLMDGVMTEHQIAPGSGGAPSTLTIRGDDLSRVMDYINFTGIPYPAMPAEARVLLILAKYAAFGIIPLVLPSVLIDVPIPVEEIPVHQGTDLQYIRTLGNEVGYVFFVEPGPVPLTSTAFWGPTIRVGPAMPALNVDMDAHTNVENMSFSFNSSRKLPVVFIQEPNSRVIIPIPIPDITPLSPPLGVIPPIPKEIDPINETANKSPVRAALIGLAKAAQASQAVTVNGSLDVVRYGRPLKTRRLVGVRGAGAAFEGLYFVAKVTHNLKRGEYKQSFTLTRNGLLSTVSRVPV